MATQNSSLIRSIEGIILLTPDFKSQRDFYRDTLRLPLHANHGDAAFFDVGGTTLGIFGRAHHPEAVARLGGADHGLSHLEFGIRAEDEAEMTDRLDAANARAYRDNFQDKDGNLFHFKLR